MERIRPKNWKPKKKRAQANRKRFTEENVKKLPVKRKQYLIWDEGTGAARGLAILVSPTGTKSYRCVFYYPGSPKPHWMHLGRVGEMELAEARKQCRDARGKAEKGEDPTADDPTKSDSFNTAVEDYIQHEQIGRHGNKSALDTQRVMLNNTTDWHALPVATLRYQQIDKLLESIRDLPKHSKQGRPYLANRLYSHLKDFFGWCVQKRKIATSPMNDMEKPWDGAKRRERPWFKGEPADVAIKAIWRAADEIGGREGKFLKLMLLTGKRPGEQPDNPGLAPMRWEHIDKTWFWDAPPSKTKNKRLHGVPLPPLAQRVLHPRQAKGKVFEGLDEDRRNFEQLIKRVSKLTGIERFFLHGIRHLVETKMAEQRDENERSLILPHVRDLLLDHVPTRGTGKDYDHHDYIPEMRHAMEIWSGYVERLVTPAEGVVTLR